MRAAPDPARRSHLTAALALASLALGAACSETAETASTTCEGCHRPIDAPTGIEEPHAAFAVKCIQCHAGDPEVNTVAGAHVANPGTTDIRNASIGELAAIDAAYRRFINPSDGVAAATTCGSGAGANCHQAIVDSVKLSVHTTAAGLLNPQRFDVGLATARAPTLGAVAASGDGLELTAITVPAVPTATASAVAEFLELAFAKDCTGCHLSTYGAVGQGRPQNRFANGCAACHVVYAEDGLGKSGDATLNKSEPGHPLRHELVSAVPDRQCEYCHFRSLRVGTQFRGLRELNALDVELGLPNALRVMEPIHGYPSGYYVARDDVRVPNDFTPPDVHQARGMGCVDCHVGQDVHGDGHLRATMGQETGIECSDCHGTFDRPAGASGEFVTSGGAKLERIRKAADGKYYLRGALDGLDHPLHQLSDLNRTLALDQGHDTGNHGDLECSACHTAWMQNFYLVERTVDLREMSANPVDGKITAGKVSETNRVVTLDTLLLGVNADGKVGTFMAKNELLTVIAPCDPRQEPVGCESTAEQPIFGKKVIDKYVGRTAAGEYTLSFVPATAHTTADKASVRACETCHPRQYEIDLARPRATYGYGRGIMATLTGSTAQVDLSRMIDENANPVVPFGHPGSGPVPLRKIQRALRYHVVPPLR